MPVNKSTKDIKATATASQLLDSTVRFDKHNYGIQDKRQIPSIMASGIKMTPFSFSFVGGVTSSSIVTSSGCLATAASSAISSSSLLSLATTMVHCRCVTMATWSSRAMITSWGDASSSSSSVTSLSWWLMTSKRRVGDLAVGGR